MLAHPTGHLDGKTAAALLGGPALYLVGNLMFKRTIADRPALSHMVGLALLAATIALVPFVEPLTYSLATTSVLVLVAVWETLSLRTPPTPGMKSSAGTPAVS